MRSVGCHEIADDPKLLSQTMNYMRIFGRNHTPGHIMFPWLPTLGLLRRYYAGDGIYAILDKIIRQRKKEAKRG
jgi:hypothetical protein